MQEKVSAQYKNEIEMAKAQRDYELKKAAYDKEVNAKKAESEMAYQLQVAVSSHHVTFICFGTFPASKSSLLSFHCKWFALHIPGSQDKAVHRGGEDAGSGGGAHAADHAAGTGNNPQGKGAGGQSYEAGRCGEIQAREVGRGPAVSSNG